MVVKILNSIFFLLLTSFYMQACVLLLGQQIVMSRILIHCRSSAILSHCQLILSFSPNIYTNDVSLYVHTIHLSTYISRIRSLFIDLVIQFVESSHNVEEGDTDFTYNLVLNKSRESEETYTLRIEGISNTAGDEDFSIPSSSVVFPPTASTINVSVTIIGDMRIESSEQFSVSVSKPGFLPTATVDTVATINIKDNDDSKFPLYGACYCCYTYQFCW